MSVNIFTEWGPLREIVVGTCFNLSKYNIDLSFKLFFNDNIKDELLLNNFKLQEKLIEQREEDLNNFQKTLEDLGIMVFRPLKLKEIKEFNTTNFKDHTSPVDNPRDQTLIIGNEIIETPCIWRRRYFENELMKDIFMHYFKKGARWSSAPKPTMRSESFDFSYVDRNNSTIDWTEYDSLEKNYEIMFDAAQCLKFGRDIIFNVANENHVLGAIWLQNHLGNKFKVHQVRLTDHHIDGMFMPLRPGVLLINPESMEKKLHLLPKELQKWEMIVVPEKHQANYATNQLLLASANINVNVLSIDEQRVIIFGEKIENTVPLVRLLEKHGFTPIPIQLRHSRLFGGGAHCVTLDTVRQESLETYL